MKVKKFSKREAIRFGWNTMKTNFWFFVGLFLLAVVIYFPLGILEGATQKTIPLLALLINLISFVLEVVMGMGFLRITLRFCGNEKGKFSDLFSAFPLFFKYFAGMILYGLMVFGGLILFIVPGIIWALKFQFYGYLIVDEGLGPIEALKKSSVMTRGTKWHLLLFGSLLTGMNFLGALCLLVGLSATVPTSMVAGAFVYRKLLADAGTTQSTVAPQTTASQGGSP